MQDKITEPRETLLVLLHDNIINITYITYITIQQYYNMKYLL